MNFVIKLEDPDVTIDVYCSQCRRKCDPKSGVFEDTYTMHCKRHGQQATVVCS